MWKYLLAWFPMVPIAILNGVIREYGYSSSLTELQAHQLSSFTAVLLFGIYIWNLMRAWPPDSSGQALGVGVLWLVLTVAFEFGFGLYVRGLPLERLLFDYDILAGRVWVLVLAWITLAPWLSFQVRK